MPRSRYSLENTGRNPWFAQLRAATDSDRQKRVPPDLSVPQILAWADAHYLRTGRWPTSMSGAIHGSENETWLLIEAALCLGLRGLPGGRLTLARLLVAHRGTPPKKMPRHRKGILTIPGLLAWADQHLDLTGDWPHPKSGKVVGAPGERWANIDAALREGRRGLPGGSSLAQFLAEERGYRHHRGLPRLTEVEVLSWAEAHRQQTGRWPTARSGPVLGQPGECWQQVEQALYKGLRGLPGGSSLARLRVRWRRPPNPARTDRPLTEADIVRWARAHHARTGCWPNADSGAVAGSPGDTWNGIDGSLRGGHRALDGNASLAQLLAIHCGVRNRGDLPSLSETLILEWADDFYRRRRRWPRLDSGGVPAAPDEVWYNVDAALREGARGLPGGSSLPRLLAKYRGVRNRSALPRLSEEQIARWLCAYRARTGHWPTVNSGPVAEAPDESWQKLDLELRRGGRGLPGGASLFRLAQRLPILEGELEAANSTR